MPCIGDYIQFKNANNGKGRNIKRERLGLINYWSIKMKEGDIERWGYILYVA